MAENTVFLNASPTITQFKTVVASSNQWLAALASGCLSNQWLPVQESGWQPLPVADFSSQLLTALASACQSKQGAASSRQLLATLSSACQSMPVAYSPSQCSGWQWGQVAASPCPTLAAPSTLLPAPVNGCKPKSLPASPTSPASYNQTMPVLQALSATIKACQPPVSVCEPKSILPDKQRFYLKCNGPWFKITVFWGVFFIIQF